MNISECRVVPYTVYVWYDTGLQSEIAGMDTFGDGRPSNDSVPFLSTSHYLREKVGAENRTSGQKRASTSMADSELPCVFSHLADVMYLLPLTETSEVRCIFHIYI